MLDVLQIDISSKAVSEFSADVTPIETPYFMSRLIGNGHTKPGVTALPPTVSAAPPPPKTHTPPPHTRNTAARPKRSASLHRIALLPVHPAVGREGRGGAVQGASKGGQGRDGVWCGVGGREAGRGTWGAVWHRAQPPAPACPAALPPARPQPLANATPPAKKEGGFLKMLGLN